jgi:hypothetical protein
MKKIKVTYCSITQNECWNISKFLSCEIDQELGCTVAWVPWFALALHFCSSELQALG